MMTFFFAHVLNIIVGFFFEFSSRFMFYDAFMHVSVCIFIQEIYYKDAQIFNKFSVVQIWFLMQIFDLVLYRGKGSKDIIMLTIRKS
jgi:hypothetical protein